MTAAEIDILKKALFILGREEVSAYNALPDEEVIFSKEFEDKIQKIAKKRKSFTYRITKTVPRRIAVSFIAAIITCIMMMSISAIRKPITKFFMNIYEDHIDISIEDDGNEDIPENIEELYLPSYMIDGYTKIDYANSGTFATTAWMNDNSMIMLQQTLLKIGLKIHLDNEGIEYKKIIIKDAVIYYFYKEQTLATMWTNGIYMFTMTFPKDTPLDEALNVIRSLKAAEDVTVK